MKYIKKIIGGIGAFLYVLWTARTKEGRRLLKEVLNERK